MRKITHAAVLTAFSTLLGFVSLTVVAQPAPDQIVICNSTSGRITFSLNDRPQALDGNKCGTYPGRNLVFYTEYGRNPRFRLRRALGGGQQYNFQRTSSGGFDVVQVEFRESQP